MNSSDYADLLTLTMPEVLVAITAFVVLIVDLAEMRHKSVRAGYCGGLRRE